MHILKKTKINLLSSLSSLLFLSSLLSLGDGERCDKSREEKAGRCSKVEMEKRKDGRLPSSSPPYMRVHEGECEREDKE